jgi:tetratricopeptide (TPR) repeat protein
MIRRTGLSRLLPAVLLLLVVFCLGGSAQAQNTVGNIVGQVRIARGNFPPERIQVTLITRGLEVNQAWTDDEGKFAFYRLPGNLYHVIISDEKYEYREVLVKVDPHLAATNIINVQLDPKSPAKPDAPPPSVAGGNPYLVDQADYEKQFPRKVIKEFEEGVRHQADGKSADAIRHFQAALKLAPDFYPAHNNLGVLYLGQGNFPAAQTEFESVLALKQSDTQAYFNLANVLLLTSRYDDCLRVVEEGLRRQPNSGFGRFLVGSVYSRMGKLPEAERSLHDAIQFDPSLSGAHLELVNLYLRQQRAQEAISELKSFLKLFPESPLVPKARETLARLESSASARKQ